MASTLSGWPSYDDFRRPKSLASGKRSTQPIEGARRHERRRPVCIC